MIDSNLSYPFTGLRTPFNPVNGYDRLLKRNPLKQYYQKNLDFARIFVIDDNS